MALFAVTRARHIAIFGYTYMYMYYAYTKHTPVQTNTFIRDSREDFFQTYYATLGYICMYHEIYIQINLLDVLETNF